MKNHSALQTMHPICPKAGAKNNLPEKIVGQVVPCESTQTKTRFRRNTAWAMRIWRPPSTRRWPPTKRGRTRKEHYAVPAGPHQGKVLQVIFLPLIVCTKFLLILLTKNNFKTLFIYAITCVPMAQRIMKIVCKFQRITVTTSVICKMFHISRVLF